MSDNKCCVDAIEFMLSDSKVGIEKSIDIRELIEPALLTGAMSEDKFLFGTGATNI